MYGDQVQETLKQPISDAKTIGIMGCGRIGSAIAVSLCQQGHKIIVIENDVPAFDRIPSALTENGNITLIDGDGTLESDLLKGSLQDTDIFVAATGKDSSNVMGGQIAKHILMVPTVICIIRDTTLSEMYSKLGIQTINTVDVIIDLILHAIKEV